MFWLKVFVIILCSALFWLGGFRYLYCRRFILPSVLMLTCLYITHWDWWVTTMLSCIAAFSLGYGDNSCLRHIFGNGWGRGVWGVLAAICLSLALFLTHHLSIWFFVPYLALNFILENALKDLPQKIGDPIIGLGFASIVFLIR